MKKKRLLQKKPYFKCDIVKAKKAVFCKTAFFVSALIKRFPLLFFFQRKVIFLLKMFYRVLKI